MKILYIFNILIDFCSICPDHHITPKKLLYILAVREAVCNILNINIAAHKYFRYTGVMVF